MRRRLPVALGLEQRDRLHAVQDFDATLHLSKRHMLAVQVGHSLGQRFVSGEIIKRLSHRPTHGPAAPTSSEG